MKFFFSAKTTLDATIAKELLTSGLERLKGLSDFSVTSVDGELRKLAEERGLKAGPAFGVFRIAVTGKKITPPLFESMVALLPPAPYSHHPHFREKNQILPPKHLESRCTYKAQRPAHHLP